MSQGLIIVSQAAERGIVIDLKGSELSIKAPKGAMVPALLSQIKEHKQAIIEFLIKQEEPEVSHKVNIDKQPSDLAQYPSSYAQKRMWLLDSQGDQQGYIVSRTVRVRGELDLDKVRESFYQVYKNHEILRTAYIESEGDIFQVINPVVEPPFTCLSGDYLADFNVEEVLTEKLNTGFDLSSGEVLKIVLAQISNSESYILIGMHHITTDAWSVEIFIKEFIDNYLYLLGQGNKPDSVKLQYKDYAVWQRNSIETFAEENKAFSYWKQKLRSCPTTHSLPLDHSRDNLKASRALGLGKKLEPTLLAGIHKLVKEFDATPFMIFHAVLSYAVSKFSTQEEVVIGTPMSNRPIGTEPLIGLFVNSVALRTQTTGCISIRDYIEHVKLTNIQAQENSHIPLDYLVNNVEFSSNGSVSPFFQILLSTNTSFSVSNNLATFEGAGITFDFVEREVEYSKFDLEVDLILDDSDSRVSFKYDSSIFEHSTINSLLNCTFNLLEQLANCQDYDAKLSSLELVSEQEKYRLTNEVNAQYNANTNEETIPSLIAKVVNNYPDSVAIYDGEKRFTFKEVDELSNCIAGHLIHNRRANSSGIIAVYFERSAELVISILAILKANAAYLPIDPELNRQRVRYLLESSSADAMITNLPLLEEDYVANGFSVYQYDAYTNPQYKNLVKAEDVLSDSLAYIIYTSGSTGTPKGVKIHHKQLTGFIPAAIDMYGISADDRILQFTSPSFDVYGLEVYTSLCVGASLVIRDERVVNSQQDFYDFCRENLVNVAILPTAFWHHLVGDGEVKPADSLRLMAVMGEPIQASVVNHWNSLKSNVELHNSYGPTEATIIVSSYLVNSDKYDYSSLPIGKPAPNAKLYILDQEQRLAPYGAVGEIYIAGDCLSSGYLNDPERTAQSFNTITFVSAKSCEIQVLYRTGDFARYDVNGNIEFLGRKDRQVKLHGYRIELNDIEVNLSRLSEVDRVYIDVKSNEGALTDIVAYISIQAAEESEQYNQSEKVNYIRSELLKKLPAYMVPSKLVVVDNWPLTVNGKVDKSALEALKTDLIQAEIIPLKGEFQLQTAELLSHTLSLELEYIGSNSNFFELGGHSLQALSLAGTIVKQFELEDVPFGIRNIFANPLLSEMAKEIEIAVIKQQRIKTKNSILSMNDVVGTEL